MENTHTLDDFTRMLHRIRQAEQVDADGIKLIENGMEISRKGTFMSSEIVNAVNAIWMAILNF